MTRTLLICFIIAFILPGCVKDDDPITDCNAIPNLQVTSNSPVLIGQDIQFSVPEVSGYNVYYSWTSAGGYAVSSAASADISYAQLGNEGWYYIHVYGTDCNESYNDSVYIDVQLNQGNPSCATTTNNITYDNISIADQSYTNVDKGISSSYGSLALEASNSSSDIGILFHPYWNTREPEDGIYNTNETFSFDQSDPGFNKVFVYTVNQSILWGSHPNQQVYVSHVNGKLKVRYCDLTMSGSNGTSYTTHATGDLTEQ